MDTNATATTINTEEYIDNCKELVDNAVSMLSTMVLPKVIKSMGSSTMTDNESAMAGQLIGFINNAMKLINDGFIIAKQQARENRKLRHQIDEMSKFISEINTNVDEINTNVDRIEMEIRMHDLGKFSYDDDDDDPDEVCVKSSYDDDPDEVCV